MVESFADGDGSANYGVGYGPSQHNGDLQGIIDSLDHIKSLNVNAIWLTPVFDSCAGQGGDNKLDATGYFACDFLPWIPTLAAMPSSNSWWTGRTSAASMSSSTGCLATSTRWG